MGVSKESISKFLIGNRFHVKLHILSPYWNRKDWGCVILREIDFLLKICWSIPCLHPSWKEHTSIEICARLNHRKKTKADGSRLIPRKYTETLVLLSVPDFLDNVWFSDEAHFLVSDHVNSKNNIFWGSTPPEHCLQRPLHSVKCTAWVAISKHGIIGPFWFEDDNERVLWQSTPSDMSRCLASPWQHLVDGEGSSGSSSGSNGFVGTGLVVCCWSFTA